MANLPQVSISTDLSEGLCFGCGKNNPIGLKLNFQNEDGTARAEFTPGEHYQGWPGVVHGGIVVSLLDEAMSYATYFKGVTCLTAKMEIKLKRPAMVDEPLIITSSIIKSSRKIIETKAQVCLPDGTLLAESRATHYVVGSISDQNNAGESRSND